MKASPADQRRLLDVAALDARLRQAERERTQPAAAEGRTAAEAARREAARTFADARGGLEDLRAELARIEADVAVVEGRERRDAERLASTSNAKDAQGLDHELASLRRRRGDLEDAELVVMERVEAAEVELETRAQAVAEAERVLEDLSAQIARAVADATARIDAATRDRTALVSTLPDALVAAYDRAVIRSVGAALLRAGTCEGCRILLSGTDLAAVRRAAVDDVLTCPECECLLVRTEESGL